MQSLRGLGASAELSPLPELLDAMEIATRTLLADVPPPPNVAAVFADAAHAMSAMARAVADAGRIVAPPELASIARRLLDSYASETDVVPISSLAPDGAESVIHRGAPPSALPDADPVPVELVSVGDHLLLVAEGLARPVVPAARDLKLFVLHRTVAAMPARSATGRFLAPLTEAIAAAIAGQMASERPDAFLAMLRGCGKFLIEASGTTDRATLTRRRDAVATSLRMVGQGAPAGSIDGKVASTVAPRIAPETTNVSIVEVLTSATTAPIDDIVDIASLAPDDDIVDIATLAPDAASVVEPAPFVPDIPAEAPGEPSRLEHALGRRRLALLQETSRDASMEALIRSQIVAVDTLLYRGPSALRRADEVRLEIQAILGGPAASLDRMREQLDELLDLVPLARDAA